LSGWRLRHSPAELKRVERITGAAIAREAALMLKSSIAGCSMDEEAIDASTAGRRVLAFL